MSQVKSEIRWCEDIGMFAFDRPIPVSCVHRTDYCEKECFNVKLYKLYPDMEKKDIRNEAYWQQVTGEQVRKTLKRKRKQVKRVRFMTRGEAIRDYSDIHRVYDIVTINPDSEWWMPTRAWRDPLLMAMIQAVLKPLTNRHVLASMDLSNTPEEWEAVRGMGWSTMYINEDKAMTHTPLGEKMFKCPKTYGHVKGACETCKRGCFEGYGRVDVSLWKH